MTDKDKLLGAKAEDLFRLCSKHASPKFSAFLDGGEAAYLEDNFRMPYGFNTMFFGGFPESERKVLGVFPEWSEPEEGLFPISIIKISSRFSKKLTHRDYLGTILSLGIDRSKTGDIIVCKDGTAYAAVYSDIAEYICSNIHKIGNQGVKIEVEENILDIEIEREFEVFGAVCASMRADAVTAAMAHISRSDARSMVENEYIKVNHRIISNPALSIKEGDLISIHGFGRYILESCGTQTRSGRLHINVKKFI